MIKIFCMVVLSVSIYAKPMVTYIRGDSPIILTSPHGTSPKNGVVPNTPLRKNSYIKGFKTIWDTNTKKITKQIQFILINKYNIRPYVIIANFNRAYIDANRKPKHAYEVDEAKEHYDAYHNSIKMAISSIKKKHNRGLLLDIHGQKFNPDTIYLGTLNKKSIKIPIYGKSSINDILTKSGYEIIPKNKNNKEIKYKGGYTIHKYGSHHKNGIDSIQIEIGKNLRMSKKDIKLVSQAIAKYISLYVNSK